MIDKVQKIRKEVKRLINELIQEKEKGFGSEIDDVCILELQNILTYIDSLQEEPVSEVWHDASDLHDESKLLIVKLISGQVALYRGSFNNAQRDFGICEVVEHGSEPKGIIEKWCYLDDILPNNK